MKSTPMLDQYHRLKAQNPTALLFFRLGDFYELFEEDAVLAAPLLDVQLTSRDGVIPMCGVPYHAVSQYLRKLVDQGHVVAIAEQMEEPQNGKGLVQRQIVRVVSPGTYISEDADDQPRLAVLYGDRQGWALAVAEVGTGQVYLTEAMGSDTGAILAEWDRWKPAEYLTNLHLSLSGMAIADNSWFGRLSGEVERELAQGFGTPSVTGWGLADKPRAQRALIVLWRYVERTQHRRPDHLRNVRLYQVQEGLELPPHVLEQLDVITPTGLSLQKSLDRTLTPMGSQLLKLWLQRPLNQLPLIQQRHRVVQWAVQYPEKRRHLREILSAIGDLAKRVSRLSLGYGAPRDLGGIRQALLGAVAFGTHAAQYGLMSLWPLDILEDGAISTLSLHLSQLNETLPLRFEDGNVVRDDADPTIGRLRALLQQERESLAKLEAGERERTGIRSLKVGYHRSFGYFWEVSKGQIKMVPADWIRRQTMTNAERYTSESLRNAEQTLIAAEVQLGDAERAWLDKILDTVLSHQALLLEISNRLAEVDVLLSLADVAADQRYVSPQWIEGQDASLSVSQMRHPVLERIADYVPNDLVIQPSVRTVIITGPNMGGKSTFMRALALNIILAHLGSMVAAQEMILPLCDGIYARIGADDNIMRGQSTFMVEMEEMAWILRHATARSLVLLDELGRGTSTFDGMAIARAVLERLAQSQGPIVLFATHYHELTELAQVNPSITNLTVEVLTGKGRQLVFTHRVLEGVASQSYGIQVAQMAGLPQSVIARARHYLDEWESALPNRTTSVEQVTLFAPDPVAEELRRTIAMLDIDELSPRDAWQWIAEWHTRLTREEEQ